MKQISKAWGIVCFMGMMLLGNGAQAADEHISTVDSQELFRSQLVKDNKDMNKAPQADKAVEKAVADLPQLNSRLRWAAVKTTDELEEEQRSKARQKKAVPIIITAADIDREKKARKRGDKTDTPSLISPRPLENRPPKPAPAVKPVPHPSVTPVQQPQLPVNPQLPSDTIELPPVMPVQSTQQTAELQPVQDVVELPPVERVVPAEQEIMAEALAEVMTVELVVDDITTEELPPVQPVGA